MAPWTHRDHMFFFQRLQDTICKKEKHETLESVHLPLILPSKSAILPQTMNSSKLHFFLQKIYMYIKSLHVHHIKTMCLNTVILKSAS